MALVLFITIRFWKIIMLECFKFFPMLCMFIFFYSCQRKTFKYLKYLKTMQEFFISGLFTLNDGKVHT